MGNLSNPCLRGIMNNDYQTRTAWFNQARFGMFIHWGLYSLLSRECWVMLHERIPAKEYAKLAGQFKPAKFDSDRCTSLAKEAGMNYVVLTTRHHDGFCLFDSKVSDFTSVKTAAKRDFVSEYVKSCRKAGLKVGLYYSLLDWRFPGYFNMKKYPESFQGMVKQLHSQVRELMTNYGKIDYLFYDGEWIPNVLPTRAGDGKSLKNPDGPRLWRSKELNRMVRNLQPGIIINNRSGLNEDIDTPEQVLSASETGRCWESCMTIGDTWGHIKYNPNTKTTTQLIQNLVTTASGGGNLLLNVGPKPDGSIQQEYATLLKKVGRWTKIHGQSIYGSERVPANWGSLDSGAIFGRITARGSTVYLHYFHWPGKKAVLTGIKNKILSVKILTTGQKVNAKEAGSGKILLSGLPERPPDRYNTVIELKLDGKPRSMDYAGSPL